jgi:ABC-2 type transport system ATP-binding protein
MMIRAENLTKKYASITAVDKVSLTVDRGELVGIIGPDGAGKTTFLRMLAGVLEPDIGTITIDGKTFGKNRRELKETIGYLSQINQVYGDLTVWENIEFFGKIHSVQNWRQRGEELLRFARLTDFKNRLADQLSGGMRQKLGICCAVIHRPAILILDEPTTGVDPISRRELWLMLSAFMKQGITILVATPYLNEAERCSRVAMFHRGHLLRYDTVDALKKTLSLNVFEITSSDLRRTFDLINSFPFVQEATVMGDRITFVIDTHGKGDENVVIEAVRRNIDRDARVRAMEPTLDNIFATLIKDRKDT